MRGSPPQLTLLWLLPSWSGSSHLCTRQQTMLFNAQDASGCFASQFLQRRDGSKNCAACRENGTGVEHDRQLAHCVVPPAYISRGNPILYIFHYQELGSPIVGIVTPHYRAVRSTLPADKIAYDKAKAEGRTWALDVLQAQDGASVQLVHYLAPRGS